MAYGWQQFENFSIELMLNECTRYALSCVICNEHDLTEEWYPIPQHAALSSHTQHARLHKHVFGSTEGHTYY